VSRRSRRRRGDRGSAGLTVVLLTPVVLGLLAFSVLAGRTGTAHQDVVSAAQAAARAVSLRSSAASADRDARAAADATLRAAGVACVSTDVAVLGAPAPGGDVTVEVACDIRLSDLTDLSLPGTKTVRARATAPIDRYRGGGS